MKIKKTETIYDGFYTFRKLIIENKGETFEREQLDTGCAAAALVYDTAKEKYILVQQHRFGAGQELLEIVAGIVENDKGDPAKTIHKEIEEETGYAVDQLTHVWDFYPSPGSCTEKVFLYYAEVSRKTSAGGGLDQEHEHLIIKEYSQQELLHLQLLDAKTILAVQWLALQKGVQLVRQEARLRCE